MYSLILMTAVAATGDSSSFHGRRAGCTGCYGSAPITYSVGCYGTASYVVGGCTGCSGCWGSSFYVTPSHGCFGASCFGSGCFGSTTSPVMTADVCALPATTIEAKPASANIKIDLPAESRLYVDGQLVPGAGATRAFSTPNLTAGKSFVYDMSAEVVVDGETVREDLKVIVHAGDDLRKSFGKLIAATQRTKPTELAKK